MRLEGAPNFRAMLGGSGGRLYRSGELSALTPQDIASLDESGIDTVCDLRSFSEYSSRLSRWPVSGVGKFVDVWHSDLTAHPSAEPHKLRELLAATPGAVGARLMMIESYRQMVHQTGATLNQLLARVAEPDGAIVIHCASGKDRSGVVCALLQLSLGVPLAIVYEDYLLSAERLDLVAMRPQVVAVIREKMAVSPDDAAADVINSVASDFLDAALHELALTYGSIDSYLQRQGVSPETVSSARRRLMTG